MRLVGIRHSLATQKSDTSQALTGQSFSKLIKAFGCYQEMNDITELFDHYLSQYGSIDIAESEFKKNIHEDKELHDAYREWCHMVGSSEKNGFKDYCDEFIRSQDDVWQTLNDNDDDNF